MTFVPVNFDEAVEPKAAPGGRYDLQIVSCELTKTGEKSKNPGSPQYRVGIGFTGQAEIPNLSHYVSLPAEGDAKSSFDFKALLLKRFLEQFSIPYDKTGIDQEKLAMEMVGCSANAEVQLTEPNDSGAVYNRLVVPKLRGEPEAGRAPAPSRRR